MEGARRTRPSKVAKLMEWADLIWYMTLFGVGLLIAWLIDEWMP